jgi:membrane protease YdiL (CAAX protease family)
MTNNIKLSPIRAIIIFAISTGYFFALLFTLLPYLKSNFILNPALYWFITGYFLFVPLFFISILVVRSEGHKSFKQIKAALCMKPFSKQDLKYSVAGLLLTFLLTGIIFALSYFLSKSFGVRMIDTTPWFMEMRPFEGTERLLLLVWMPMFFFNIVGEELLWRGYIQARLPGRYSWLLCSVLWLLFHLPFGLDLLVMLLPVIVIIPYIFSKTRNASIGIFIHGIFNGPMFVAVALGFIK